MNSKGDEMAETLSEEKGRNLMLCLFVIMEDLRAVPDGTPELDSIVVDIEAAKKNNDGSGIVLLAKDLYSAYQSNWSPGQGPLRTEWVVALALCLADFGAVGTTEQRESLVSQMEENRKALTELRMEMRNETGT